MHDKVDAGEGGGGQGLLGVQGGQGLQGVQCDQNFLACAPFNHQPYCTATCPAQCTPVQWACAF